MSPRRKQEWLDEADGETLRRYQDVVSIDDAALAQAKARDGCDCPPWIMQCAHFNGGIAALSDTSKHVSSPGCNCSGANHAPYRYSAGLLYGHWETCAHGTTGFYAARESHINLYRGGSHKVALAAFHAAEARLLGRDLLSVDWAKDEYHLRGLGWEEYDITLTVEEIDAGEVP